MGKSFKWIGTRQILGLGAAHGLASVYWWAFLKHLMELYVEGLLPFNFREKFDVRTDWVGYTS